MDVSPAAESPEQLAAQANRLKYGNSPLAQMRRGPLARLLKDNGISPFVKGEIPGQQVWDTKANLLKRAEVAGFDISKPANQTPQAAVRVDGDIVSRLETALSLADRRIRELEAKLAGGPQEFERRDSIESVAVEDMDMGALKKLCKEMGLPQAPTDKKLILIARIKAHLDGQDAA